MRRVRGIQALLVWGALLFALVPRGSAIDIPEPKHQIDDVRFEHDGSLFTLAVTSQASWKHWTLANPPRIILDLGDSRTLLPNAPGLFERDLDMGVVKKVRTSQFSNHPLDRRVRVTLELGAITEYEARRVGEEIHITVPDASGEPRTSRLTAEGFTGDANDPSTLEPASKRAAELGDLASAENAKPAEQSNPTKAHEEAVEPATHEEDPSHTPPKTESNYTDAPMRLSSALERAFVTKNALATAPTQSEGAHEDAGSADDAHGTEDAGHAEDAHHAEDAAHVEPDVAASHSEDESDSTFVEELSEDLQALSEVIGVEDEELEGEDTDSKMDKARTALERLLGNRKVDKITETSRGEILTDAELAERERPSLPPDMLFQPEEEEDLAEEETQDEYYRLAAERLLREAMSDWRAGNEEGAFTRAERAYRFYGDTPAGSQAGFLISEIYRHRGDFALAEDIYGIPELPDPTVFEERDFLVFLDSHHDQENFDEVKRLLAGWASLYPSRPWFGEHSFHLAERHYRVREVEDATYHLLQIPTEHVREPEKLIMLARLQDEAGDKGQALSLYQQLAALDSSPYQKRGLARSADLLFQAGQIADALDAYERVLENDSHPDEESWARYQVGNCHLLTGQTGAARKSYESVVEKFPNSFWNAFAEERLESLGWSRDVARTVEGLKNP